MGVDYDSAVVFGWEINETNEDNFRKVLKEVLNYEKADDFSFWKGEDAECVEDFEWANHKTSEFFSFMITGNFYDEDSPESYSLLFGKNCEREQLSEVIDWFENNKETLLKIEKIMGEPPKFINEWIVY